MEPSGKLAASLLGRILAGKVVMRSDEAVLATF